MQFSVAALLLLLVGVVSGKLIAPLTEITRDTPSLIRSHGFGVEEHPIITGDGYHITLFRMINPYNKFGANGRVRPRPVLLWHGITVSSESWLFSMPGYLNTSGVYIENNIIVNRCTEGASNTLGFALASCGYDVWLANSRGSHYSNGHDVYDSRWDYRYWQYTLTEMALNDIPAAVAHILLTTGEKSLAYIGHSLGTDMMFVLQSLMPEFGALVKPYVAMAPVTYLGSMWSAARLGVPFEPLIRRFAFPIGAPRDFMKLLGSTFCNLPGLVQLCADTLYAFNGYDQANFNQSALPIMIAHAGVPQSSWVYAQLAQHILTDRYQMMDHGKEENHRRYGQDTPPLYNLSAITSPDIALYRSMNDAFSDNPDQRQLLSDLRVPLVQDYVVPYPTWNHQDFLVATTQGLYVNTPLLRLLRRYD